MPATSRSWCRRELGGAGLGLAEASVLQQRLAGAAPATALAINMHLVWTGVAKVLADRGIDDLRFVQEGAAAGEVFAFGISEAGNDLVLFGSDTDAAPQPDGSYAFTGTKIFTSLAPVWTQLGLHGLDTTSADAPQMVYAFVPRDGGGRRSRRDAGRLGHPRHARHAVPHHRAARCDRAGRPGRATHRPGPQPRSARVRHLQRLRAAARLGVHGHRPARARPRRRDRRQAPVEEDRQDLQPGPRHPLAHRRHGARVRRAAAAARGDQPRRRRPRRPRRALVLAARPASSTAR